MPYDKERNVINTKLVKVTNENTGGDIMITRQTLLKELYKNPEDCKIMYINHDPKQCKLEVIVILHSSPTIKYSIGEIQAKYNELLHASYYKVLAWQITGGREMSQTNKYGVPIRGYFGINISIQIVANKKDSEIIPHYAEEQSEN